MPDFLKPAIVRYFEGAGGIYFSQEGEDIILERMFAAQKTGFFVDIGAHHPKRFSNTYSLYLRGWRGINVDATPGSMKAFRSVRPEDQNLECGVGINECEMPFYEFAESALNTFSRERYEYLINNTTYKLSGVTPVRVRKLSSILEEYVPSGLPIDLLTVDVEGLDLDILRSNDWQRFSPKVLLVESLDQDIITLGRSELGVFLKERGYTFFAKTYNTAFFVLAG